MPVTAVFLAEGFEPDESIAFEAGVPLRFSGTVTTAAWLTPELTPQLTSETLELTNVSFNLAKGLGLSVDFTAKASTSGPANAHAVVLTIDTHSTRLDLQATPGEPDVAGIGRVYNFPNPMGEDTRFVLETGISAAGGRISLWSVAGSPVARLEFSYAAGEAVVEWDGRDARGDELANGTYLYRVEIDGPTGTVRSDMQRLVIMR
jgi:hypothetical protein